MASFHVPSRAAWRRLLLTSASVATVSAAAWFTTPADSANPSLAIPSTPCPTCGPATANQVRLGLDCGPGGPCVGQSGWHSRQPVAWDMLGQGEYVGPHRLGHVPEYRLRVDDRLEFVFRLTRDEMHAPYRLNVGDVIVIESLTDADMNRGDMHTGQGLLIQPDGTISLKLLGQVHAARRTVEELRSDLRERYKKYYKDPDITVTPLKVNTRLEDLRATIDNRAGVGGQSRQASVTPEGTVQLPGLGSVPAQGLTLDELKHEIDERYLQIVQGFEVTPVLIQRAPRNVYVLGEVARPGRYDLQGPTTVMQSIALAGGWNIGGNLRQIVVFRRAEDWRLVATKLNIHLALQGHKPCPADEIWVRDSDLVLVPKSPIQRADDIINLVFTRGIYGVVPFSGVSMSFSKVGTL